MRLNPDEPAPDLDPEQSFGYPLDEPPACSICGGTDHFAITHGPATRVYRVYTVDIDGEEWTICPICGPLIGAVLRGHGPEHIIEDAST